MKLLRFRLGDVNVKWFKELLFAVEQMTLPIWVYYQNDSQFLHFVQYIKRPFTIPLLPAAVKATA